MHPSSPAIWTFPPLVTADEMRKVESMAMAAGVAEESLMDAAALGLAEAVQDWLPTAGTAIIFAGKGHNAGDAFAMAGHLADAGWRVEIRLAWPEAALRPLAAKKLDQIRNKVHFAELEAREVPPGRPLLLVDGLLGIGARGALEGPARHGVRQINRLRQQGHAVTLAVDLPSGLGISQETVTADLTVTLGWPKEELFTDDAASAAGRLLMVALPGLTVPEPGGTPARDVLVTAEGLRAWLPPRPAFAKHKGQSGRIGILAGSTGLTGAARLAATAAAMMGGGLVTLFCPRAAYEILAAACPPEVMVRPVASCHEVRDFPLDALGIGPGLGAAPPPLLGDLLRNDPRPMVVDADALNVLAAGPWWSGGRLHFAGPRLLTPHPGELGRLVQKLDPGLSGKPRRAQALALTQATGAVVLAKSARSFVIGPHQPAAYNGTGHPLMARGGMGDVLTGFLSVFAGQGLPLYEAAALGSWLLGRAGELYHQTTGWEEPGLASDVMCQAAGAAMAELRNS